MSFSCCKTPAFHKVFPIQQILTGALICAVLLPGFANAQKQNTEEKKTAEEAAVTLPRVQVNATSTGSYSDPATVSATKMVMSLRETPQSVSVITQQQIEDWGYVNIRDILARTTGVYTSTSASQDRPSFNIRGGSANLVQIDGVQQFPGGRRPTVNGDSIAYERVEILRGAMVWLPVRAIQPQLSI